MPFFFFPFEIRSCVIYLLFFFKFVYVGRKIDNDWLFLTPLRVFVLPQ